MSQGLSLLSAIIAAGSRQTMRELSDDLFLPDELPAYHFFLQYYRQYGQFPTPEIMANHGHALTLALGTVEYNFDRIVNRASYNVIAQRVQPFQNALQQQNIPTLRQLISEMAHGMNRFSANRDVFTLHEAFQLVMEEYEIAHTAEGEIGGVTLGWGPMDALTNGAQPGEVVTWVARPNVGKSFTIAHNAVRAWLMGTSCLFVTMEMTALGMARRLLGVMSRINPDLIKRGQLSNFAEGLIGETIMNVENGAPFHLVAGNLSKSVSQVDALCQEFNPDAIFIDASYLLDPTVVNRGAKMFEKLADVGKEVTSMALTRRRPVFQTVQFNREQKKGKASVDNIGGTDVVGQISSIVVSIMEGDAPNEATQRKYEMIKNRDGAKGEMTTRFLFDPIDFSAIPPEELGQSTIDTSVMI